MKYDFFHFAILVYINLFVMLCVSICIMWMKGQATCLSSVTGQSLYLLGNIFFLICRSADTIMWRKAWAADWVTLNMKGVLQRVKFHIFLHLALLQWTDAVEHTYLIIIWLNLPWDHLMIETEANFHNFLPLPPYFQWFFLLLFNGNLSRS